MCGKNSQIYGVQIPSKCIDSRHFYSCLSHSELTPKFLPSRSRQKEITKPPRPPHPTPPTRQHSFENLFSPTAEIDGGNYDLLYQNSVRKSEDDLEH